MVLARSQRVVLVQTFFRTVGWKIRGFHGGHGVVLIAAILLDEEGGEMESNGKLLLMTAGVLEEAW